ncbi:hypothetical protein LEM8419_01922 [Neolewinella maritima]|uniref:DUF2911 domain-containing protein n=1 Tax=Neolewinella maritima TaxID=1383882 RepID=A0ABN8F229_9BACT|nr:DUF2911 domain-containing protein [Neolewinella maritima]CAH1000862.1 hypothetical protein LEM8419_01922 [Neolewinella maritima]
MIRSMLFTLCLALCTTLAQAQISSPPPSPTVKMETTVGLTDVMLEYSRPGMKGRELFAEDGLVPYGEIWRTGANQATKITFSAAVRVAGQEVPAGSYAILSKPGEEQWEVMFFPYESSNWTSYVEKTPAVTVTAEPMEADMEVETFTIELMNYSMDGADMVMAWGETMVVLPIMSNAKEDVMASIERVMAGPSANDYFQAATFLNESGQDNEKALEYIQKANSMGDARFWMVRREALILDALGRTDEAIEAAKKSMELAQEAGNMDYVRMNEKSLEEWMK